MDANIAAYIEATFQKIRRLKESEKGEVWLASEKSGRLVILKRIALTGLPYHALKEKDYALCPRVLHAWEDEGETVVVEEYVQGESLLDRIGRKAYLTEQEAQSILCQLCDGLAPIHAQGIIHRDIKPSNLILQNGGIIRLIDFDAARTVKENLNDDTRFLGTKGYAPPEQYGYGQTDERSDIFSLGITAREALSKEYHGYLAKILTKCTSLDPANRYQNVRELKRAVLWRGRWAKWGRTATAAVIVGVSVLGIFGVTGKSITPKPSSTPMTEPIGTVNVEPPAPSGEVATETVVVPATSEPSPSVSQQDFSPKPTALENEPAASATTVEPPAVVSYHDNYRPPKVDPEEIANIESIEDFLEAVKDDTKAYERWKNDKTYWVADDAPREEQEKARRNELDFMKRAELGTRINAFIENLPDTMTQEERNRAIDEYTAEQRKILGIKHWP